MAPLLFTLRESTASYNQIKSINVVKHHPFCCLFVGSCGSLSRINIDVPTERSDRSRLFAPLLLEGGWGWWTGGRQTVWMYGFFFHGNCSLSVLLFCFARRADDGSHGSCRDGALMSSPQRVTSGAAPGPCLALHAAQRLQHRQDL